jgi:hypothetical protein
MEMVEDFSLVDYIMDYESGEISDKRFLELFSYLVRSGKAWTLQGHYGRTAQALIEAGYLDDKGEILISLPVT